MPITSCPICGEALPESARYCAGCGKVAPLAEATLYLQRPRGGRSAARWDAAQRDGLADEETLHLEPGGTDETVRLVHKEIAWVDVLEEDQESFDESEEDEQRGTWQKIVVTTPHNLPALSLRESELGISGQPGSPQQRPRSFFWLVVVVLCALLLSGVFGAVISLRHTTPPVVEQPGLQVVPGIVALGGIVTLRGAHFASNRMLTLSLDQQGRPLVDTGGLSTIQSDAHGNFSDVVIIDPTWSAGSHKLYVTDSRAHQQATASLTVTGQSALQGPPHLLLSDTMLDFGAGDEASNDNNKLLALSNAGGGQLTWQASSGQSWLQLSPNSGTIASGKHMALIAAIDRATLEPGTYTTSIVFTSNTEQVTLPVSMSVIPLQPAHQAILQLSPAVLTFNATANGPDPQSQTITVSNPGLQQLSWGLRMTFPNNKGYWLRVNAQTGAIAPGGQQQILVSVNSQGLAPGTYNGALVFFNQGSKPIQQSPQSIYVSLTVAPLCTLTLAPGNLSFTGVHGQTVPAAQNLQIGVAPGCSTSQNWNVTGATVSGGNWLSMNQSSGSTPAQFQVSVNAASLAPGTYSGTLTFTSHAGQQIVPVTLIINPVACVITAPAILSVQGTAGQSGQSTQNASLGSSGDCLHQLHWTSAVSMSTPSGGTWLSATSSGSFIPPASANLTVQANLAGLSAGTYSGTVSISAVDSATNQSAGTVQIAITLTVLAQCSLPGPSPSLLSFTASVGSDPTTPMASFTIGASGNCAGNVTITPTVSASGTGWLTVTGPVAIASGGQASFTVTITSSALAAGTYNATITLDAADGNGAISSSPQTVSISLTVQ